MGYNMLQKQKSGIDGYKRLTDAIAAGKPGNFYIFYGEERYLLDRTLSALRKLLCPDGLDSFNYKRFDGKGLTIRELDDAINMLPSFAERTLVEIHDFDIFKDDHKEIYRQMTSDLPDYICLVFVFDTVPYKPDARVKINAQILENANVVEFGLQEQAKLAAWITRHFSAAGKRITVQDAEYLAMITGGYMSSLHGEIGKVAAYAKEEKVTRADIDAVVTPVLDTVAYKLTDALASRDHIKAMSILDELFQMHEAPHKLIFTISLKMRQILAARICLENGSGIMELMVICGLKEEWKARPLLETARRMTLAGCKAAVLACCDTAYELNSSPEPEARIIELITKLAYIS